MNLNKLITYRLLDAIGTAWRSDETILHRRPLGSSFLSPRKPSPNHPKTLPILSEEPRSCRSGEDTAKSSCLDYGLKVTGRARALRLSLFGDNFSTLESYLRPAVSASEGSRASPQAPLFTCSISELVCPQVLCLSCVFEGEKKISYIPNRSKKQIRSKNALSLPRGRL